MITPSYGLTATERVLPRLALDFTTAALDSRVTLTRALNTATCIGSNGLMQVVNANLPRFDFSPVSVGVCNGLLIEESRINICQYTEDLSNVVWAKNFGSGVSVTANQANGPDGLAKLDLVTSSGAAGALFQILLTLTFSTSYSYSAFVRAGTSTSSKLSIFSTVAGEYVTVTYAWSGGVPSTSATTGSPTNVRYDDFGGGLYRISFTFSSRSSGDHWALYTPDTTSGLRTGLAGYMQVELGAFTTSYIPNLTTGTTTRNADVVSMTGTNFSSWYSSSSAALAAVVIPGIATGTRPIWQLDDTTANEIIALRGNVANPELYIVDNGTPQAQLDAGTITANTQYGLCAAFTANSCAASQNGAAPVTTATATMPTVTQARIGSDGSNFLNGAVRTLRYWPQRILNAETQAFSK